MPSAPGAIPGVRRWRIGMRMPFITAASSTVRSVVSSSRGGGHEAACHSCRKEKLMKRWMAALCLLTFAMAGCASTNDLSIADGAVGTESSDVERIAKENGWGKVDLTDCGHDSGACKEIREAAADSWLFA